MGNIEHKTLNEMLGLESVLKFRHVVWVARKGRAVRVNTSLSCTRGWGVGGGEGATLGQEPLPHNLPSNKDY